MIKELLQRLEDPDSPLLGPNIRGLRFFGILHSANKREKYFKLFLNFLVYVFIITEYIDIYVIRHDLSLVLLNLQFSLCITISGFKVITIFIWQKRWNSIIAYVTKGDIDQRKSSDPLNLEIVQKFTLYSRKLSYIYWGLLLVTGLNTILQPVLKFIAEPTYRHSVINGSVDPVDVVRSWVPWSKRSLIGYIAALLYQSYSTLICMAWITTIDSCAIVILVFFRVELEVLRNDCRNMFGSEDSSVDDDEFRRRIKSCHRRHIDLLKYSRLYNSCMSPVMLLYMFMCTVMLCSITYQLTEETTILKCAQMMFALSQLFLFCWYSNEVTFASRDLMLGPYESRWWCGSVSQRTQICILIHQFQTPIVFTAGPFTELTANTFINIIKAAYSYVTILKQSNSQ